MNITMKPCTVDDVEVLKNLATQAFCETFAPLNTPENMDAYLKEAYTIPKLRRELSDSNQIFYFAYADGVLPEGQ